MKEYIKKEPTIKPLVFLVLSIALVEMLIFGSFQAIYEYKASKSYGVVYYVGRGFAMGMSSFLLKTIFGYYFIIFIYLFYKKISPSTYKARKLLIPIVIAFLIILLILFLIDDGFLEELKLQSRQKNSWLEFMILVFPSLIAPFIVEKIIKYKTKGADSKITKSKGSD